MLPQEVLPVACRHYLAEILLPHFLHFTSACILGMFILKISYKKESCICIIRITIYSLVMKSEMLAYLEKSTLYPT